MILTVSRRDTVSIREADTFGIWAFAGSMFKVEGIDVMVEGKAFAISALLEKVDNPILLFGCEQFSPVIIAVIGSVAAQESLYFQAQRFLVLAFHVLEECAEAPGHLAGFLGGEESAPLLAYGHCGIDRRPGVGHVGHVGGHEVVQALVFLGAFVAEAQRPAVGHFHIARLFLFLSHHSAFKSMSTHSFRLSSHQGISMP